MNLLRSFPLASRLMVPLVVLGLGVMIGWDAHARMTPSSVPITVPKTSVAQTSAEVFSLLNRKRTDAGLVPLRRVPELDQSAAIKGKDLLTRKYWSHTFDENDSPWDHFRTVGYNYFLAGENLAGGYMDSDALVQAWTQSTAHRENMLKPEYRDVGIAAIDGKLLGRTEARIVVAHFGAR